MTITMRLARSTAVVLATLCLSSAAVAQSWDYPETRKMDLVEELHGVKIPAPYRWLEDDGSPETKAWNQAQNELTFGFLKSLSSREALEKRLTELWNFPRYSAPRMWGGRYFFQKNDGLQNQDVVYMQEGLDSKPASVLDPNLLSPDGTTALSATYFSFDGRYLAYGVSIHGSDRQQFRIRDVETGLDLEETIEWCKFSGIAWTRDSSGFYYNRFPRPGTVAKEDENNYNAVYWHTLGTPQAHDILVFQRQDEKELGFHPSTTEDGRFLILEVYHGTDPKTGIYFVQLGENGRPEQGAFFKRLIEPGQAMYRFVGNVGPIFFLLTDRNAPRARVISVDSRTSDPKGRREVIPQFEQQVIDDVALANGQLLVVTMQDAHHKLAAYDLEGRKLKNIELPGLGSVFGLWGRNSGKEAFFSFASFLQPSLIYRYSFEDGKTGLFRKPAKMAFDASLYETKQLFFASKDGTKVPIFLTGKKGFQPTGDTPVLMYGYGGFNINLTPYFSTSRLAFLEAGGLYALVNLRGGAEYGEEWHQAGMLGNKQNVFDDFVHAARYLIESGYTTPAKMAILGGSNGGLLVTACMLQQPALFGAVVAAVPVTDMLRYHKFTVGHYWMPEYGDPGKKDHFDFLYAYSPLHNVQAGTKYPPILVTTADTDDRVVPAHSRKFVATLQDKASSHNPSLIRIEINAGHGRGKPTSKRIAEAADMYAFIFHFLNMTTPRPIGAAP